MNTIQTISLLLGAGLVLASAAWLTVSICASTEEELKDWAEEQGQKVERVEVHFTWVGTPFWYLQTGCQIYEVKLTSGSTWWIRTSILGWDVEKTDINLTNKTTDS
jgi:hypothetical protein